MSQILQLYHLLRAHLERPAKFALVGVVNTLVDISVFASLVHGAQWDPLSANMMSYSLGILNSFLLNRLWTFRDHSRSRHVALQLPVFFICNLVGLGLSSAVVWALSPVLTPIGSKLLATLVTFCWNYWTSRKFVYVSLQRT